MHERTSRASKATTGPAGAEPDDAGAVRRFPGGGGSLRDPRRHAEVLRATRELLAEVGYAKVTVEAIARRAEVGKPTIYRWWPNKAAIIHEAIWRRQSEPPAEVGDFEVDLRAHVDQVLRHFAQPDVAAALPGLVSDAFAEPDPSSSLGDYIGSGIQPLRAFLLRARQRGELRADADVGMVTDMIIGAMISRLIARGIRRSRRALVPADADKLMGVLLDGLRP